MDMKKLEFTDQLPGIGNIVSIAKAGPISYFVTRYIPADIHVNSASTITYAAAFGPANDTVLCKVENNIGTISDAKTICQEHFKAIQA